MLSSASPHLVQEPQPPRTPAPARHFSSSLGRSERAYVYCTVAVRFRAFGERDLCGEVACSLCVLLTHSGTLVAVGCEANRDPASARSANWLMLQPLQMRLFEDFVAVESETK